MTLHEITDQLVKELEKLRFAPPVSHVYNPLVYARAPYDLYNERYGQGTKEVVFLGMNPGPFGMVQTGIPFGEVILARDWLNVEAVVNPPAAEHPKRRVLGFQSTRREVSGRRLWTWVQERFGTPERFFERFMVVNYCPLAFLEESGKNRTPDKLPRTERDAVHRACDLALRRKLEYWKPSKIVGVGRFAQKRAELVTKDMDNQVSVICHPSPANPKANRGWVPIIEQELRDAGVTLP